MRFDLTDLRLFLHVVEAGNITHGAERAALALASASARIRGMEASAGLALLTRNPRGVAPTPAGEALAHHARLVLGQLEQMRGEIGRYAKGMRGQVRLLCNTAAATHLPGALARFLAAHPAIDVDVEEKPSRDIVAAVAGGLADLGLAADTIDLGALEKVPFRTDRLVLAVPCGHALAQRADVALRDVLDEPFVGLGHGSALQAHLAGHAAREGRPLRLRVRLHGFEPVCAMVAAGVGVAIVPDAALQGEMRRPAITAVPLRDLWASRRIFVCARSFAALSAHARELVGCLAENAETSEAVAATPVSSGAGSTGSGSRSPGR